MGHELDKRIDRETGEEVFAGVFVGDTPWHRLGVTMPDAPGLDKALELGGLEFDVAKVPHFAAIPATELEHGKTIWIEGDPYTLVRSEIGHSVMRLDRNEVIGTVGDRYVPLQNEEAFGVLRPMIDDGIAVIESAGSLRRGAQVWMLVRFDVETIKRKARELGAVDDTAIEEFFEECLPYALFMNDHSGKAKAIVKETAVRVVCANTLEMSLSQKGSKGTSIAVSHTGDVASNYKNAADILLGSLVTRFKDFSSVRDALKNVEVSKSAFRSMILDPAVPIAQLEARIYKREGTKHTETALRKATEKRDEISRLWTEGIGHVGDHSAWEAYNGLAEWIDHSDQAGGTSSRLSSLYDGTLGKVKRLSLGRLSQYAGSTPEERMSV